MVVSRYEENIIAKAHRNALGTGDYMTGIVSPPPTRDMCLLLLVAGTGARRRDTTPRMVRAELAMRTLAPDLRQRISSCGGCIGGDRGYLERWLEI